MGFKTASFVAHDGMCGPRDLTAMTSSRSRAVLFSRLFTFDCKGEHLLTCAPSSGIIYKVFVGFYKVCISLWHYYCNKNGE